MTHPFSILTKSVRETQKFAANMAASLPLDSVVALIGEIGAGKTTFAQGFAAGFGVAEFVNSPTFKLVSEYEGKRGRLYHIDCYRLNDAREFIDIGGESFLNPGDGITLIEWAERVQLLLPDSIIQVEFSRNPARSTERLIAITGWRP